MVLAAGDPRRWGGGGKDQAAQPYRKVNLDIAGREGRMGREEEEEREEGKKGRRKMRRGRGRVEGEGEEGWRVRTRRRVGE